MIMQMCATLRQLPLFLCEGANTIARVNSNRDVIVAGAGPVGMLCALGLARAGARVTVLESEPGIVNSPRAAVYLPVTLRVLDRLGLLEEARRIAVYNETLQFLVRRTGKSYRINSAVLKGDTEYPYHLHFGQDVLAGMVQQRLLQLPGTQVRFNTRVESLVQDAAGVTVTVSTSESREQLRCGWLVGADGAHSIVRKALGIEFRGHTWPDRYVATNIYYDEFPQNGFAFANFCVDPELWAVVAILSPDNLWRVTYNEDGSITDEEVRARIPSRLKQILPAGARYELAATSPYRVHERAGERFRLGRVLLAGDAAHVCNPVGGMGLTTGVMDTCTLADTLGAVINGLAGDAALDFYDVERRRVFWEFSSPSATEYRRIISEADPDRQLRDQEAFRRASEDPAIMRQAMMASFAVEGSRFDPAACPV